jgi:hypothetical protein
MDPTMLLNPIGTAPRPEQDPEPLLLYCPHEQRWYTGVWRDGAWRLHDHGERVLHPTHWLPVSTEVVVESARPAKKDRQLRRARSPGVEENAPYGSARR